MDARTSKRRSQKKKMIGGEDIISTLPDHILHQILSCLTTKEAVATSVLSTRWKYLWISVPNLEFICFTEYGNVDYMERNTGFTNFVDRVLRLHDTPSINKFSITCRDCDPFRFNEWVSTAIKLHVQELILDYTFLTNGSVVKLPSCLFLCETLTVLKIIGDQIEIPTLISLPNLKALHVESISFIREELTEEVSFSCPILEKITLVNIYWKNINTLKILTPKLKSFDVFDNCDSESMVDEVGEIEVYAENLTSLQLITPFASRYSLDDLSSLVDATIEVTEFEYEEINDCTDLLKGVCNVRNLTLGFKSIGVFSHLDLASRLLTFARLSSLTITFLSMMVAPVVAWGGKLINFLCNTANVESLNFPTGLCNYTFEKQDWTHATNPDPFLPRLKIIEFGSFSGRKSELCFFDFFLTNVTTLEKMNIKLRRTKEEERKKIVGKLQRLAKGSNCVVKYT